jgi:hypothetical protein
MNAVDTLTEIIKSAQVGFPPTAKQLEHLRALMVLEGLKASPRPVPALADHDE